MGGVRSILLRVSDSNPLFANLGRIVYTASDVGSTGLF